VGQSRREFIKSTSAALGVAGIAPLSVGRFATDALNPPQSIRESAIAPEPSITELAAVALDAAKSAGAEYADVRFVRNRNQNVSTREQRVSGVSDNETYGFGARPRRRLLGVLGEPGQAMAIPPINVRDFSLSSLSGAI
jgi:TldD protein